MAMTQDKGNFLDRFLASPQVLASGVKAEPIGKHNIRVSKGGRMLGIWRKSVGCYQWFPAGQNHPQATVLTIDEAVRHLQRSAC
jgi:hypothetical protein